MNHDTVHHKRVLAIDPTTKGFGFALLEGPDLLVDWGTREARGDKHAGCLKLTAELMDRYGPDVIVTEDPNRSDARRCGRVRELIRAISESARERGCKVRAFARSQIHTTVASVGARTKQEIAVAIADRFPELAPRLPPVRKPWMSEDARMSIFDAMALALTFYRKVGEGKGSGHPKIANPEWKEIADHITKL